jgi:thioredoxin-related protein
MKYSSFQQCFLLVLALTFFSTAAPKAAELLMFEQQYCAWCERWNDEIGGIYHKTTEGIRAPLRRIDIHDQIPVEFAGLQAAVFTPTFVLWENGQEIARLRGYPGDEFFWFLLSEMLEKLPKSAK